MRDHIESTPTDPLCYRCRHRGTLVRDCHSKCSHPATEESHNEASLMAEMGRLTSKSKLPEMMIGLGSLTVRVRFAAQGVEGGWAHWPTNFDPIWLEWCTGFESANEETTMRKLNVAETAARIENWIANFVNESKTTGVVLGVSGGIDSALTGALCVDALGASSVRGMVINVESTDDSVASGLDVARQLGIEVDIVNLSPALLAMEHALSRDSVIHHQLARANLKSRLRMCALYAKANEMNRLVIGTTNLTEAVLGYYTKYGDGGVDFEPIIGLLKREVREVATFKKIASGTINRTPSAELWNGQTDEDELGFPYDALDAVVEVENHTEDTPIQNLVWGRYRASDHKRKMPPGFTDIVLE